MFATKRIYAPYAEEDGFRVLVDRLWPRGMSKEKARLDLWLRDLAPSTELRQWFGHEAGKWPQFQERYRKELGQKPERLAELEKLGEMHPTITLLYGAKDQERNEAVVLAETLNRTLARKR
jgi:DNA-3-methyladenine glycosylase